MLPRACAIAGPRSPPVVLASSNKRDVVYATRGRAAIPSAGGLWPHQSVANEPGDWWWNPLSHRPITTSVQGQRPARPVEPVGVVVDADEAFGLETGGTLLRLRDRRARGSDSYFDDEAENLTALLSAGGGAREDEKLGGGLAPRRLHLLPARDR